MIAFLIGFFLIILVAAIALPLLWLALKIVFYPIGWIIRKITGWE